MEKELLSYINGIEPIDQNIVREIWNRWDSLCKPLRSFGKLEEIVAQIGGIQGKKMPSIDQPAVVIMAADNGVVAEGISQTGQEVTAQVVENMGNNVSAVCILADNINAKVFPVNIGVSADISNERVWNRCIKKGTNNIKTGPAMSREETIKAIYTGIEMVETIIKQGKNLIITGEMGIGNTTTSSAVAAVVLDCAPELVTGKGAGLSGDGLKHKCNVIKEAISYNQPDPADIIDVLSKVGGLDLAGLTGCYLGAALYKIPILIDGFISSIAAYCAMRLNPICKEYMIATHCSKEPAGKIILEELELEPILFADMHMGEGTGAAVAYPVIESGFRIYDMLPTFQEGNVKAYEHLT